MKIKLEQVKDGWRADCLDLPGTPPCGDGKTKEMAVVALFYCLLRESQLLSGTNWIQYIKLDEPIFVNDVEWEYPDWMKGKNS